MHRLNTSTVEMKVNLGLSFPLLNSFPFSYQDARMQRHGSLCIVINSLQNGSPETKKLIAFFQYLLLVPISCLDLPLDQATTAGQCLSTATIVRSSKDQDRELTSVGTGLQELSSVYWVYLPCFTNSLCFRVFLCWSCYYTFQLWFPALQHRSCSSFHRKTVPEIE